MRDFIDNDFRSTNVLNVDLGVANYDVQIGSDLIKKLVSDLLEDQSQTVIIIDSAVTNFVRDRCKNFDQLNIIELAAGKESKTFTTLTNIFSKLEQLNLSRNGKIIAIGGGVIGDVAGLAACLWYRGCELVHVPTTLLASVDSCLGGKTAINLDTTINAIGSYYHPSQIIIDTDFLENLPARELKSGLAEVIKYSVLGNEEITKMLNRYNYKEIIHYENLKQLISLCLMQKIKFVVGDVEESNKRLFLNLGHTIGHALEINSIIKGKEMLRHGEGVALGLIAISKIAVKVGVLCQIEFQHIIRLVKKFGLRTNVSSHLFACDRHQLIEKCIESTFKDKKRTPQDLRLILPTSSVGPCKVYSTNSRELIQLGIEYVLENTE